MNRTDRLVALVMLLQSQRVTTAAQMAAHFEVAERTIYRDLVALGEAGVPVVGEAGVGYRLMRGYHLPPVMFSPEEALALVTGGFFVEQMTDASVSAAMRAALRKVAAVLPPDSQDRVQRLRRGMQVGGRLPGESTVPLGTIQRALAEARTVHLRYRGAASSETTERVVEPLGLVFHLDRWHLFAWCRSRQAVRDFRVDRIAALTLRDEPVPPRPDFDLARYLAQTRAPKTFTRAVFDVPLSHRDAVWRDLGPGILAEAVGEKCVRLTLAVTPEVESYIVRWLLGLGLDAQVVEPAALRKKIVALAEAAITHHRPGAKKRKRS